MISSSTTLLIESNGWKCWRLGAETVWFAGYLIENDKTLSAEAAVRRLTGLFSDLDGLAVWLRGVDGHFAAVIQGAAGTVAITDVVASFPLFLANRHGTVQIGNSAAAMIRSLGLGGGHVDPEQALSMAMAGFTTGPATLYRDMMPLACAEVVAVRPDATVERRRWSSYRSWEIEERSDETAARQLRDLLLHQFERLKDGAAGRPIAVPLSAGLDSRLIVSALRHVGARDVRCFAYGLPDNFEAAASRRIAEALGYAWTFVPYTRARQRAVFASSDHAAYVRTADSAMAVPFEQDYLAIRDLRDSGWLPPDAVLVNGQSGDFITGGHVSAGLARPLTGMGAEERWGKVFAAQVAKHYGLWRALATPANLARIEALLRPVAEVPENAYGLYELLEYENRQSKYVVGGQRVYDHFGLDWRLPLWDRVFVDFWRTVPVRHKLGQALYRDVLMAGNWGGVWQGFQYRRTVTPSWIRPLRLLGKVACLPLGRNAWHALEKRCFFPWMDVLQNMAAVPFRRVLGDGRGYRNAISWLTEIHLARHALDWRGQRPQ